VYVLILFVSMQITTIFMCTAYTALAAGLGVLELLKDFFKKKNFCSALAADLGVLELLPDPVALLRRGACAVL
jgi:hypothetical protein